MKRWDTLFVCKEISRINFSLHLNQPVEIILEILCTPNACLFDTCVATLIEVICPKIKVLKVEICSSWIFRHTRSQVIVNPSYPIHMLFIFFFFLPRQLVLNHVEVSGSVWEWDCGF